MKRALALLILIFCSITSFASHIYGGEMIYEYISTSADGKTKTYRITLLLFRDDLAGNNAAALPTQVFIGIFDYGTKDNYPAGQTHFIVNRTSGPTPVPVNISPCITGNVRAEYSVASYSRTFDLPVNEHGYLVAYETCCRVNNLANVFHTGGTGGTGSTYVARIPGTRQLAAAENNSSPKFVTSLDLVCYDRPFTWNFGATDPDGDVLEYSFAPAYHSPTATSATEVAPRKPATTGSDYPLVTYIGGYSANQPLGGRATIDPRTGIISGIAPPLGQYVVAVLIREFRNGVQISEHRKDFILRVQDCQIASAELQPNYPICNLPSFQFKNEAPSSPLIRTYYWEFSQGGSIVGTSNQADPTFNFPTPGEYNVKLTINRGDACENSATSIAKVWPGFKADFDVTGFCIQIPSKFEDKSTTNSHGSINRWSWDFGEPSATNDVSTIQNPSYQYPRPGTKSVRLIVGSDRGCIDTVIKQIDIYEKPPLRVITKDTLMCFGDTTQLSAFGNGNFTWTPLNRIRWENTATPEVWPTTTTTYYVRLDDDGCINEDSIRVRVVNFVTLDVMPDTTICRTDSVQLRANTNGLRISWDPSAELNDPTIANPKAKPLGEFTTYTITSRIGRSCIDQKSITVRTVPYPLVNAGSDTTICYNTSVQLNGSMDGTQLSWSPANSLSDPNILDPIARPPGTTNYVLTVYNPTSGCPKPSRDTVTVTVLPKINASGGNDTAVVVGQPLQLLATGGTSYIWSPGTALNSTTIPNPIGVYDGSYESIRYKVTAFIGNCFDSAYVNVKIFKTPAQVFVPTGFTPNRDGKNDVIRPIAVGITKIEYFRIFNRWGQMVFSTTRNGEGWDGRIKGQEQGAGVYVWVVKAIDFTGKEFFAKGTLTLIR